MNFRDENYNGFEEHTLDVINSKLGNVGQKIGYFLYIPIETFQNKTHREKNSKKKERKEHPCVVGQLQAD